MLVVLSDLHLTDRTSGVQAVSASTYEAMFQDLRRRATESRAESITVLYLGDIFDMIRTTSWFEGPHDSRPWMIHEGLDPNDPAVEMASRILDQIAGVADISSDRSLSTVPPEYRPDFQRRYEQREQELREQNRRIIELLANPPLLPAGGTGVVHKVYVPGNHDRILNCHPRLRRQVREILKLGDSEARFPNFWEGQEYGVFARHGHEWDHGSFAHARWVTKRSSYQIPDEYYMEAPVSEFLALEMSSRLPVEIRDHLLREKPRGKEQVSKILDFEERLSALDDVRPMMAIGNWLQEQARRRKFEQTTASAVKSLARSVRTQSFFRSLPGDRVPLVTRLYLAAMASAWLPFPWLVSLIGKLALFAPEAIARDMRAAGKREVHLLCKEPRDRQWTPDPAARTHNARFASLRYFLTGHTHLPVQWPATRWFTAHNHTWKSVLYVNTGTWRPYHHQALDGTGFSPVENLTCTLVFCSNWDKGRRSKEQGPLLEQWSWQSSATGTPVLQAPPVEAESTLVREGA